MKDNFILFFLIFSIFLISSCATDLSKVPTGYNVKETETKQIPSKEIPKTEQKPSCTDKCSANSCNLYEFISCELTEEGCKLPINKGIIKGKCNVKCKSNSDCKDSEQCSEDFICVEKLYSMNQNIQVDYLTYKVTRVETFTEMGTSFYNKKTNGKFVKVYLDITNNAKETKQIFSPRFRLIDSQNRQFDRLSDDMLYISDYLEFGKQLQPSLAVSGAIVFELPKDSENLNLIIKGNWVSIEEVRVPLSNIKNIGVDTTQKEEQDKMWDQAMEEGEAKMEEIMGKCNAPFKCSSNCAKYSDTGQKDCPSGQVCCMTEQSEIDDLMSEAQEQAQQQVEELMNQCISPFACTSSCPQYMDVGQKNCPSGQVCCIQT